MYIYTEKLLKMDDIVITNDVQIIFSTIDNEKILNWLLENHFPNSFIEDMQNEDQSITYEETEKFKLIIMKYIRFDEEENLLYDDSNVVIIKTKNKLFILAQEKEIVTELAKKFEKKYKKSNSFEYLIYITIDILIDNTILLVDVIDETLEDLEDSIFHEEVEEDELQKDVYYARRTLNRITKVSIHERDIINKIHNKLDETHKHMLKYEFIDLTEHLKYLINESKTLLERTGYLLNLHMGILSTRMNKAMQRLAAISLIFLPLTFIVGNYGMNFKYMPELNWKYGYFATWIINISIAVGIYIWLKRKKWI
ncbi:MULTISPECIES: magnesium transporter CorA family protein [unclassified Lebetimonas]|uniref:magnesium transporter CorA family protein n=1 Tax=unclassified Lebetimonas TaxID=2648158 RepID=UPI00046351B2|nr:MULTISPECIES: magnesium transporter CorA family protein [unclassified Lebetimonas]